VEVGTANLVDPGASLRIVKEIQEYCRGTGVSKVEDMIGTLRIDKE
jgi:dihydroorotate dehydrogenase